MPGALAPPSQATPAKAPRPRRQPSRDSAAQRAVEKKLVSTLGSSIRDASCVRWGTIHEFKGMEAQAVILTDISGQRSDRMLDLIYAGATSATDRLIVLTE